jgi:hypothetical protein
MKVNGEVIGKQDIADSLNSFFISVGGNNINKNVNNKPLDYLQQAFNHPSPSLKYHAVTSYEIFTIIKSSIIKNSHGYDEISVKVLKK